MLESYRLTAIQATRLIANKELTSTELVRSSLERIEARESIIGAWESLDAEAALLEAQKRDHEEPRGLLHGLPIGIKDIIDTLDFPTRLGSPAFQDRQPHRDAGCVRRIKDEGGIILGKNTTTEFAYFSPADTRNPHNPAHTPGGSSSGSAAAVADFMVPLSVGTQAAGSTVRPASFCGVIGFKPTYQRWDMGGALRLYPSLDTLSIFARSVSDALLVDQVLGPRNESVIGFDRPPKIALYLPHEWDRAGPDTIAAMESAKTDFESVGAVVSQASAPSELAGLVDASYTLIYYEACQNTKPLLNDVDLEDVSSVFLDLINKGKTIPISQYEAAKTYSVRAGAIWAELMSGFDAALTPSVVGEAPEGLNATGDPVFIQTFNVIGVPTMNLPHATGTGGLPVGVQLVGAVGKDRRLLGTASWLMERLGKSDAA